MDTVAWPVGTDRHDTLRGGLVLSLALHALLFLTAIFYTVLRPHWGGGWGSNWGGGEATRMGVVSSLPGVPLPVPMMATRTTLANENPGLYQSEPEPKPQPTTEHEVEIPKFQQEVKPEKAIRVNKRIQKEPLEMPDNAVPFGLGGRPLTGSTTFSNAAGDGSLSFGQGGFGDRYPWYVEAVRNRISNNWLLSTISASITSAPRVYVTFDILRDGTITNVETTQSSGVPEVDRSALRAVLASNPLGPLPPDFPGSRVSVRFYFDFRRR